MNSNNSNLIDINTNIFKCGDFSSVYSSSTDKKTINNNLNSSVKKDFIDFHTKTKNNLSIIKSYNINEITNQTDNSLLKVKINPNFQNEFALINSNFAVNYLVLNSDGAFNIGSFQEHTERVNDISFFKNKNSPFDKAFVSAGNDGTIKLWDTRSPNSAKTLKTNGIKIHCMDTSEDKLVAGFGREVGIWDLKMMKNLYRYKAAHCEDVTSVKLNGQNLLTSGEDCIINHFNLENGLNMDAIVSTLNLGQPPASVDFIDDNFNIIQACTTVYTMEICNFEKGSSQYTYNSIDESYNTEYCLEAFLVENNHSLRNSKNKNLHVNENNYSGSNYLQLFSGNNYGDLVVIDFILNEKIDVKVNSIIKTNEIQTFNSISKTDSSDSGYTHSIAVSDTGNIYIIDKKNDTDIQNNSFTQIELPEDLDEEEQEVNENNFGRSNKKNTNKISSNKFNPY